MLSQLSHPGALKNHGHGGAPQQPLGLLWTSVHAVASGTLTKATSILEGVPSSRKPSRKDCNCRGLGNQHPKAEESRVRECQQPGFGAIKAHTAQPSQASEKAGSPILSPDQVFTRQRRRRVSVQRPVHGCDSPKPETTQMSHKQPRLTCWKDRGEPSTERSGQDTAEGTGLRHTDAASVFVEARGWPPSCICSGTTVWPDRDPLTPSSSRDTGGATCDSQPQTAYGGRPHAHPSESEEENRNSQFLHNAEASTLPR
ncbi:uncharacterized protein LOC109259307 [Panthera pardus]|uniref:Uncharacterized protein LOC109259307 n=1 Tax=Panthera pardus TaxID=9691 RepID=A0A9V1EZR8_PANPR|nr:uncharacterized protein LOC109259307 [Panthera pardus]